MDYGLIGKRDKARRYAEEERERFTFHKFEVEIKGSNNNHVVKYTKVNGTVTVIILPPMAIAAIPWRWRSSLRKCLRKISNLFRCITEVLSKLPRVLNNCSGGSSPPLLISSSKLRVQSDCIQTVL